MPKSKSKSKSGKPRAKGGGGKHKGGNDAGVDVNALLSQAIKDASREKQQIAAASRRAAENEKDDTAIVGTDAYRRLELTEDRKAELQQKVRRKKRAEEMRTGRAPLRDDGTGFGIAGENGEDIDLSAMAGNSKQARRAMAMISECGLGETMKTLGVDQKGGIAGAAKRAKDKSTAKALKKTGVSAGQIGAIGDALEMRKDHDKRREQRHRQRDRRRARKKQQKELDRKMEEEGKTFTMTEKDVASVTNNMLAMDSGDSDDE